MRSSLFAAALLTSALTAGRPAAAQPRDTTTGPTLTLEEANALAQRNNPTLLTAVNNRRRAAAGIRSAYGAFLPDVNTSFGTSFREGRPQYFAGQAFGSQSDQLNSSFNFDASVRYNAATFIAPRLQRANADAVEADIVGSQQSLRTGVTQQYITVLQQQARAALQDTLISTAQGQLELARARVAVGAATVLDVRRAEVALGQQQVAAIQARNQVEVEKLRLFQQMGVEQPGNVQLTSSFAVADPSLNLPQLLEQARRDNPTLNAFRSRERVAELNAMSARADYTPTLSVSAGVGGFTNKLTDNAAVVESARLDVLQGRASCIRSEEVRAAAGLPNRLTECQTIEFTDAMAREARSQNSQYPFDFTRNPYSISASLSLPIFNGFAREQRVQEAAANRSDAQYNVRAQQLRLTADVTAAYLTLTAARQTVTLQQQNAATAREALELAQERYRVGANTFLDVSQARSEYERAQTDLINAIYEFHRSFAALENAVGRPLR
jgi:outer membrane protein